MFFSFKALFPRSVKNFIRRVIFCFFDVRWKFSIARSKLLALKAYYKETKKRSAYKIFYATCEQGVRFTDSLKLYFNAQCQLVLIAFHFNSDVEKN